MYGSFRNHLENELGEIIAKGLNKEERTLTSAQGAHIKVAEGQEVINFCANNYLGLAQHAEVRAAAQAGAEKWGYGLSSVRFICGTQTIHKNLEDQLSDFLGMEDTILFPSCFDANGGLFETLLTDEDAVISDELNHASIIDGVRLCKAKRYRYQNNDMADLERQLITADKAGARFKLITSDGVFSMDGYFSKLDEVCDLAEKYSALVHFDDAHATGFVGAGGRGTHEYRGCMDRVDIITSTLGKALGGASGGFVSAHKSIVDLLRQRARPYLFSNSVPPPMVAGALKALEIAREGHELRLSLLEKTHTFRNALQDAGLDVLPGEHPIIPIMLYDGAKAIAFANAMLAAGVYVVAFSYPVVPEGKARIRVQMSAGLSQDDIDHSIEAFAKVNSKLA